MLIKSIIHKTLCFFSIDQSKIIHIYDISYIKTEVKSGEKPVDMYVYSSVDIEGKNLLIFS